MRCDVANGPPLAIHMDIRCDRFLLTMVRATVGYVCLWFLKFLVFCKGEVPDGLAGSLTAYSV